MVALYILIIVIMVVSSLWLLTPRVLESRGNVLRTQGDFDDAISVYSMALRMNPTSPESYIGRGASLAAKGDAAAAIPDLDRGIELLARESNWKPDALPRPKTAYERDWVTLALTYRGVARAVLGDIQGAFGDLDTAVRTSPMEVDPHRFRAVLRTEKKDFTGARADYDRVLTLEPHNATVYQFRASLRLQEGDYEGAMQDLEKLHEHSPDTLAFYLLRGQAHQGLHNDDEALADYTRFIDSAGRTLRMIEKTRAAATRQDSSAATPAASPAGTLTPQPALAAGSPGASFNKQATPADNAVEAMPAESTSLRFTISQAFRKQPMRVTDAEVVASDDPESAPEVLTAQLAQAYHNRAIVRTHRRDFAAASADLVRTLELAPDDQAAQLSLGVCEMQQGHWEPALQACARVIAMNPRNHTAYSYRCTILMAQGDFAGAAAEAERAIEADPAHDLAYLHRALARMASGDFDGAIADYTRLIEELSTQHAVQVLYNRGLSYLMQGKAPERAEEDLSSAIRRAPHSAHAYTFRGIARVAAGNREGAMADFTYAVELAPRNPAAYANRGMGFESMGRYAEAIHDYRATIEWGDACLAALPRPDATEAELAAAVRPAAALLREDPLNRDPVDFSIIRALEMQSSDPRRFIGIALHAAGHIRGATELFRELLPPKLELIQKRLDEAIKKQWAA